MRLVIALLLVIGGGLAALAIAWLIYTTSDAEIPSSPGASLDNALITPEISSANQGTGSTQTDIQLETSSDQTSSLSPEQAVPWPFMVDIARIGKDGSAVFAGKGIPQSTIRLYEGGDELAVARTNLDGEWVAIPDASLSAGNHLIIAEMTAPDGSVHRSERAVIIELSPNPQTVPLVAIVPMTDEAVAEIISVPTEIETQTLAQNDPKNDPLATPSSALSSAAGKSIPAQTSEIYIGTLSWGSKGHLQIKGGSNGGLNGEVNGGAKEGARVSGSMAGQNFSDISLSDDGDWSANVSLPGEGRGIAYIKVHLHDREGNIDASAEIEVNMSQLDIGLDGSEMVIIQKGDVLWRIAYKTFGQGIRYLDIVKRNQQRIKNPDLIYPAQVFALPEIAPLSGQ